MGDEPTRIPPRPRFALPDDMREGHLSSDVLDAALDRLLDPRGGDLDPALERYPDQAELRRILRLAGASQRALSASLPPEVRARHTEALMTAAREKQGATWSVKPARPRPSLLRRLVLRPIAVMAALLLVVMPATAAMASGSLPDSRLYGVKIGVENLQLLLEGDLPGDVDLHISFASRRVGELGEMEARGKFNGVPRALENLQGHLSAAALGIEDLDFEGAEIASLEAHLLEVTTQHLDVLEGLADDAGCDPEDPEAGRPQCKGLLNAIENSSKHLDHLPSSTGKPEDTPGGKPQGAGSGAGTSDDNPGSKPESQGKPEGTPSGTSTERTNNRNNPYRR